MTRAERTRRHLQETALGLFADRGFDGVTVDEIAAAAGVSHMTFFRYFPTKDSVVLDDPYDPILAEIVVRQDRALPPVERVRRGILEAWASLDEPGDAMTRSRVELAASHPSLRAGVWQNNLETEDVIVEALVDSGVDELEARVATGAVLGALTAALFDWARDSAAGSLGDRVRTAMRLLEPSSTPDPGFVASETDARNPGSRKRGGRGT